MKISIPESFMKLAAVEGLTPEIASDFYLIKQQKKSADHIRFSIVRKGIAKTETEAGKLLTRVWKNYLRMPIVEASLQTPDKIHTKDYESYLDRASKELDLIIGKSSKILPGSNSKNNDLTRIAVAGDFHFPFANKQAIATLLEDPADTLIMMGDYFDMYSVSKYRQTTDRFRVSEELAVGKAYMEKLSAKFSKIYMIKGNHDERALRRVQEIFPQLLPLIVSPLDLLAKDFSNVEIVSTTIKNTAPMIHSGEDISMDFMAQLDDCVYGHFEGFCGADAPRLVDKWISEWSHILNLPREPRVIAQAHTHRLSAEFTSKGKLLLGTGCMCNPMQYQIEGHKTYKPPVIGYAALYQKDGVTDLNKTQLIHIGVN